MKPYYKAFNELKELIDNAKLEVVYDTYEFIPGSVNSSEINYAAEVYSRGDIPVERRYDIKVDGNYFTYHKRALEKAFAELHKEIKRNCHNKLLSTDLKEYSTGIKKVVSTWNERIVEREVEHEGKKYWILFDEKLDDKVLKSEGISKNLLERISAIFDMQQNLIIQLLLSELWETIDSKNESSENTDPGEEEPEKIGALDAYQTALLFDYLRKHNAIQDHGNSKLAALIHALTGHSSQNLRTDKGFGVMAFIKSGKAMNKNFSHIPNYNLVTVKDLLNKILDDIRLEIENNNRK